MNIAAPETTQLLADATCWRMLGLLFRCPGANWLDELNALAAASDDTVLQQAAAAAREEASALSYHTIFGPGGPAAAREVSYQRAAFSGQFLAELRDFYAAFAYESSTGETPDHIATQADFIGYLRLKEAYARARGDREQADLTARAAERLVAEHLALIAEPLMQTLSTSSFQYLALAAAALYQRVGPAPSRASAEAPDSESLAPLDPCGLHVDD